MNISDKALELIIRDVLGGMAEIAILEGYDAQLAGMEILGIESSDQGMPNGTDSPSTTKRKAVVLPFPNLRKIA